jgi:biopolymer transport protein ExbD
MRNTRSIRARSGRRKIKKEFELQLTSLLDVLVIILVFLLKSYQASTNTFSSLQGMQVPFSKSPETPPQSLHLIITPEALTFENERIMDFLTRADSVGQTEDVKYEFKKEDTDEGGRRIIPLFNVLTKAKEQSELLRAKSQARDEKGNPLPFEGILAIQADKRINYDTIRRVMYTAAAADFRIFRFLAIKKETE